MELKGNKGEWSELYAFLKLLADGYLFCGDGHLNRYDDKYYPILEIFRDDSIDRNSYKIQNTQKNILITGHNINIEIPQERFKIEAEKLFAHIKDKTANNHFSHLEPFLNEIDIHSIKAKSSDKADIRIIIHNLNTGSKPELGYSIKSNVGANPTLINSSSDTTNFIYNIDNITDEQIEKFNSLNKFKSKFEYLDSINAKVSYSNTANQTLHNNLIMLDLGIERIIAEGLLIYYSGKERNISNIANIISKNDPLSILCNTNQPIYEYKIKQFLLAFALGLTCSKPWQGQFHANGGYIVIKENGDIICYHFFDRNDLEDYLFYNTCFETPSTSRHKYGFIYKDDITGRYYLKLNLQIRFK